MLDPSSTENRILVFSAGLTALMTRFPVLRFFGNMNSAGDSAFRRRVEGCGSPERSV